MNKKKIFEYLLNCSNKNIGMNDNTLYLAVLTLFEQNLSGCGRLIKIILVGSTVSAAPVVVTDAAPSSALPGRRYKNI